MKAYLMYPQQDFDPEAELPVNEIELVQDLELDVLFGAMAKGDRFLYHIARQALLCSLNDLETIRYRQDILRDCLKNAEIIRELYQISIESVENKRKHHLGIFSKYPSSILSTSLALMGMFVELLKKIRSLADEHSHRFESEGFRKFFRMIQTELDDEYIVCMEDHLQELRFRSGVLISARLGRGNEGSDYILRKPNENHQHWLIRLYHERRTTCSFVIADRDEAGGRFLSELKDRGINLVANALAQSADHIENFFKMLRVELAFYIGCLNLSDELTDLDEPMVLPDPVPMDKRQYAFKALYDVCLALTMKQKVVGNDGATGDRNLVVITGANQGGKSTFLRSAGLAQIMMQSGMFVAAEEFSANICDGIFTHYKRKEDSTMESGKLDEELSRMSAIVDHVRSNSLVLFNESFAATNEREGSEIARQITTALLEKDIKVFFVTHLYEFAHGLFRRYQGKGLFLRAERQEDGSRTFKLRSGEPIHTSFGFDVYKEVFNKNGRVD